MILPPSVQSALSRHQQEIYTALRHAVGNLDHIAELQSYYGRMQYHLGWVDTSFIPMKSNPGKLLRPTLLLLAYEIAGAWELSTTNSDYLQRALPAAAAIELTHNFTLIHDDIEDRDSERRHRSTVWNVWGIPQAINTGDGMFSLARLTLWDVLEEGVEAMLAVRLAAMLDSACLVLSEGQYLDMSFEERLDSSVAMYVDMISRKTAALMSCAVEMGALLGTRNQETIDSLRRFGWELGIAFQVRDDLLGVWGTTAESGKSPAGDVYRRKKSLPIIHALEQATLANQQRLRAIYSQDTPITTEQVEDVLAIFECTGTKAYCHSFLAQQCRLAHEALEGVPRKQSSIATRALDDMQTLVHFLTDTVLS